MNVLYGSHDPHYPPSGARDDPPGDPGGHPQHHNIKGADPDDYGSDPRFRDDGDAESTSSPSAKYRRSYRACTNCRSRKVRCDLGELDNRHDPPCARCRREGKECVFTESRRGGMINVLAGREKRAGHHESSNPSPKRVHTLPSSGPRSSSTGGAGSYGHAHSSTSAAPDSISQRELYNSADALEILAHAARSFPKINHSNPHHPSRAGGRQADSKKESVDGAKGSGGGGGDTNAADYGTAPSESLADADIIAKEHLITETEARNLIAHFFEKLHPFYPFIPTFLHEPNDLAGVPILLAAITTLSSRYYVLGQPNVSRQETVKYETIHEKLWDYCQRLISETVWAEASTRSLGTVFAFLLFSEWNPRAIHRRGQDYANSISVTAAGDGLAGLGASRRSDRLSWMLIGNAIRLAQDLGVIETSSKVFLATHLSETLLALRMGRKAMLSQSLNDPLPSNIDRLTKFEQAELAILQIMSLAHETLYSSRGTTRELLRNGRYLTFLALFGPHLDKWEKTYQDLIMDGTLERETLVFDYHYTRLYIYSLALSEVASGGGVTSDNYMASVAQILPSSRYVAMAIDAAKEMLAAANRVHEMGVLSRAPVRWVTRIVHAAIFLVKSIMLSPTSTLESHRHTLSIIRTTSRTLIDSSPDEIHLSSRYGTILLKLSNQLAPKVGISEERGSLPLYETSAVGSPISATADAIGGSGNRNDSADTARLPPDVARIHSGHSGGVPPSRALPVEAPSRRSETPNPNQESVLSQVNSPQQRGDQNMFDFSRYAFSQPPISTSIAAGASTTTAGVRVGSGAQHVGGTSSAFGLPAALMPGGGENGEYEQTDSSNQNLMSMLDMEFDFLMEGTEGLGFVEPLMEGIEQHQNQQEM